MKSDASAACAADERKHSRTHRTSTVKMNDKKPARTTSHIRSRRSSPSYASMINKVRRPSLFTKSRFFEYWKKNGGENAVLDFQCLSKSSFILELKNNSETPQFIVSVYSLICFFQCVGFLIANNPTEPCNQQSFPSALMQVGVQPMLSQNSDLSFIDHHRFNPF